MKAMIEVYDHLMKMSDDRVVMSTDAEVIDAYQELSDVLHDRMVVGEALTDEQCEMLRHYEDVLRAIGGEPDDIDGALINYREMVKDVLETIKESFLAESEEPKADICNVIRNTAMVCWDRKVFSLDAEVIDLYDELEGALAELMGYVAQIGDKRIALAQKLCDGINALGGEPNVDDTEALNDYINELKKLVKMYKEDDSPYHWHR